MSGRSACALSITTGFIQRELGSAVFWKTPSFLLSSFLPSLLPSRATHVDTWRKNIPEGGKDKDECQRWETLGLLGEHPGQRPLWLVQSCWIIGRKPSWGLLTPTLLLFPCYPSTLREKARRIAQKANPQQRAVPVVVVLVVTMIRQHLRGEVIYWWCSLPFKKVTYVSGALCFPVLKTMLVGTSGAGSRGRPLSRCCPRYGENGRTPWKHLQMSRSPSSISILFTSECVLSGTLNWN